LKLVALLIAISCIDPVNVDRFFGNDHAVALSQINKYSAQIESISRAYEVDGDLVKSIVFPEYIRNSVFSGIMEEQALAISYVEFGSGAVDFSIGQFQIKPSFAQKLENSIKENKELKQKYGMLYIDQKDPKAQRLLRFNRLKDISWQTRYVCCFIDYCEVKYQLRDLSKIDQLKFMATAYNVGIKETAGLIEANYEEKTFPYGKKFNIEQLSYWEVSVNYYLKYCKSPKIEDAD
jgi:hypothetical protein